MHHIGLFIQFAIRKAELNPAPAFLNQLRNMRATWAYSFISPSARTFTLDLLLFFLILFKSILWKTLLTLNS